MTRMEIIKAQLKTEDGIVNFISKHCNKCNFCKREWCCYQPDCKRNIKKFLNEEMPTKK